jgi:hypothetical protein
MLLLFVHKDQGRREDMIGWDPLEGVSFFLRELLETWLMLFSFPKWGCREIWVSCWRQPNVHHTTVPSRVQIFAVVLHRIEGQDNSILIWQRHAMQQLVICTERRKLLPSTPATPSVDHRSLPHLGLAAVGRMPCHRRSVVPEPRRRPFVVLGRTTTLRLIERETTVDKEKMNGWRMKGEEIKRKEFGFLLTNSPA